MTNNTPDYNDNLAFEPEMTWEELVKWVKDFCKSKRLAHYIGADFIRIESLSFHPEGWVNCGDCYTAKAENRTPRQMRVIIKTLYE